MTDIWSSIASVSGVVSYPVMRPVSQFFGQLLRAPCNAGLSPFSSLKFAIVLKIWNFALYHEAFDKTTGKNLTMVIH